jgi:hypothetical protein
VEYCYYVLWGLIFLLTSFLYASAGLGGASAYLAYLSVMGIHYEKIPPAALTLGLFVSGIGMVNWWRWGYLNLRILIPFLVFSTTAAYFGALMKIAEITFTYLLIAILFVVSFNMLLSGASAEYQPRRIPYYFIWLIGASVGSVLGFISGIVGIGGGIFLIPTLVYLRLCRIKEVAAAGATFIFFNSIFGILGHIQKESFDPKLVFALLTPVVLGGFTGSFLSARYVPPSILKKIFGFVILFVAILKSVKTLI